MANGATTVAAPRGLWSRIRRASSFFGKKISPTDQSSNDRVTKKAPAAKSSAAQAKAKKKPAEPVTQLAAELPMDPVATKATDEKPTPPTEVKKEEDAKPLAQSKIAEYYFVRQCQRLGEPTPTRDIQLRFKGLISGESS